MAPRVFVSHSHHDIVFTNRLVADLSAAGADVWVDVVGIERGDFQERINEALGACQFFVLVLTPEALAAPWVRMETNAAIKRKMQGQLQEILPIVASPIDPRAIPPTWDTFQRFDATLDYAHALAGITRALRLPVPSHGTPTISPQPLTPSPSTPLSRLSSPASFTPITQSMSPQKAQKSAGRSPRRRRKVLLITLLVVVFVGGTCTLSHVLFMKLGNVAAGTLANQAAMTFCSSVEEQGYPAAYQMLSKTSQGKISQEQFITHEQTLDATYGRIYICSLSDQGQTTVSDDLLSATMPFVVKRVNQENDASGTLKMVSEGSTWKLDAADPALTLI